MIMHTYGNLSHSPRDLHLGITNGFFIGSSNNILHCIIEVLLLDGILALMISFDLEAGRLDLLKDNSTMNKTWAQIVY